MNKNVQCINLNRDYDAFWGVIGKRERLRFQTKLFMLDGISREPVVLNDTFLFSYPLPNRTYRLNATAIWIIFNNNFFHLFTLKGVPVTNHLEKKVRGPVIYRGHSIYLKMEKHVHDSSMRKMVKYDVSSFRFIEI